jgi:hypothetical protein
MTDEELAAIIARAEGPLQMAASRIDTLRLAAELRRARDALPDDLRADGWSVGCHNDYRQNGERHTFWLLTKGDRCIVGEGHTDAEALNTIRAALAPHPPVKEE